MRAGLLQKFVEQRRFVCHIVTIKITGWSTKVSATEAQRTPDHARYTCAESSTPALNRYTLPLPDPLPTRTGRL